MFRMQYPNINGNDLCDGQIHNISPYAVSQIEDLELFLLEYYDENYSCNCTTILHRTNTGIKKIPLLNYDLLFEMIDSGKIKLEPVDLHNFMLDNGKNDPTIQTEKPVKDFHQCLTQTRATIILYIDTNRNIYYKNGNNFVRVDGYLLSQLMQNYDIEWHRKETNALASKNEIDDAIYKTMGHMLKRDRYDDGLSFEERYKINNIHHYSVNYQYTDDKGFKRGSFSI